MREGGTSRGMASEKGGTAGNKGENANDAVWDGGEGRSALQLQLQVPTAAQLNQPPPGPSPPPAYYAWHDAAASFGVLGAPTYPASTLPKASPFDRLPAAAKATVEPEVWAMSRWSSGEFIVFETNASHIALNMTLEDPYATMEMLMPRTGTSGSDLYTYDVEHSGGRTSQGQGQWRWIASNFEALKSGSTHLVGELLAPSPSGFWRPDGLPPSFFAQPRKYLLYLPLYNGPAVPPASVMIGVEPGAFCRKLDDRDLRDLFNAGAGTGTKPPIAWFGTSIAEGGAAARPGAQYLNVLSRQLRRIVLNFGFAGPGQEQLAIVKMIAEVVPRPGVIVIDCLPDMRGNASHALIAPRLRAAVAYLRGNGHAATPIILPEGTDYSNAWSNKAVRLEQASRRAILLTVYNELVAEGDRNLHFVNGSQLWGVDPVEVANASPTVRGVHPSTLGEERLAWFWTRYFKAHSSLS